MSETKAPSEHAPRLAAVEAIRFVGSILIIWFHIGKSLPWVGLVGLEAFIILSTAFAGQSGKPLTVGFVRSRAWRLLAPWVFWSAVYGAAKVAQALAAREPLADEFEWWMLGTGPQIHLWYLPAIFVMTLAAAWMASWGAFRTARSVWIWSALALVLIPVSAYFLDPTPSRPWAQYLFALPAFALGCAFSCVPIGKRASWSRVWLLAGAALVGGAAGLWAGDHTVSLACAGAGVACAVVWGFETRAGAWLLWAGSISYGVYLIHPLIANVLKLVFGQPNAVTWFAATAAISVVAVTLLRRTPLARMM